MRALGIIDTYEEWLKEYISWTESRHQKPTPRCTMQEYFERYFPKGFDPKTYYDNIEKHKKENIEHGIIFYSCSDHGYYNAKGGFDCPQCKH